MQITVKEAKFLKDGESKKGKWRLFKVVSQDGVEYTTFDTKAEQLSPGAVIEIGDITIKDGDKRSFKELAMVSEGKAPASSPQSNGNGMSQEAWAEKDRITRQSIESQKRADIIAQLWIAGKIADDDALVAKLKTWLGNGQVHTEIKTRMAPAVESKDNGSTGAPETVGEMFTAAAAEGVQRSDILKEFGIPEKEVSQIIVADLWPLIVEKLIKPAQKLME